jgi:hypothetical protein
MPLAGEKGLVAAGFENRSQRPLRSRQAAAFALEGDGGHSAAVGNTAGLHGSATRRAAWLGIEGQKGHAFGRNPVKIRGRHAAVFATSIGARVSVTEVIRHDQDDVWFLILSLRLRRDDPDP